MKPLDEEGRRRAAEAFQDERRMTDRYAAIFPEHAEEIESSAAMGLVRAASSFKPAGGEIWDRWKSLCTRGEIKNFLGNSYLQRRVLWTQEELERVEDRPRTTVWEEEEGFEHLLGLLPAHLKEICTLVYHDGMSPYSAGQALGMTGRHGCRLHKQALDHLRKALAA